MDELRKKVENRVQNNIYLLASKLWYGSVLQCLRIIPTKDIPTACVQFDKNLKTIKMMYNYEWFDKIPDSEIRGVLIHEIEHVLSKHLVYGSLAKYAQSRQRLNIAMDLVINQKITNIQGLDISLPKEGCFVENFKDKSGAAFPLNQAFETYYDLLIDSTHDNPNGDKGENGEGARTMDAHDWEAYEEKDIIQATSDLLKRANNLHEKSHNSKSKELSDYLDELHKYYTNINYKEIFANALRNALDGLEIDKTWSKPSRRYGCLAKGNKFKPEPSVEVYGDTSGSIGYEELMQQFSIISEVFKYGVSKINLNLFHTNVYYTKPFKKNDPIQRDKLESGGTCLEDVLDKISKSDNNLAIIITDGYYDRPNVPKNIHKPVFFLIRDDNNIEHPLKDVGRTLKYRVTNG
jgi:predicted metal-dependent peptidase